MRVHLLSGPSGQRTDEVTVQVWQLVPPATPRPHPAVEVSPEISGGLLVAQMGKNLPAVQETQVRSLGWMEKIPLEEGMATHCSTLAQRIPGTEEPAGLQSMGVPKELDTTV